MLPADYVPKLKPFDHQAKEFLEHARDPLRAILWEQGTGKTKEIIDQACYLYELGEINCLIVLAPGGVHRNWIEDEVPDHLPDRLVQDTRVFFYQSSSASAKWHEHELLRVLRAPGLALVSMTYDQIMTDRGKTFLWKLLRDRRCMYVLDEHTDIKNPASKRGIRVIASGAYAKYKRIMDGTPINQGPFDVFGPVKFLDPEFWKRHGMDDFGAFKTYFGIYEKGYTHQGGEKREFLHVVGYRRLGELNRMLDPIATRVLKDEVLDLPPKLYSKRYHELSPEQARVYKDVKEHFFTMLEDGRTVSMTLPIVQLLRLQQIVCGYVPVDEGVDPDSEAAEPEVLIGEKNPRLDLAKWYCDNVPHKAIIWARFRKDIDLLMHYLGSRAVRYDGQLSDDQLAANKHAFQTDDKVQFFVGNPAKGARGLTLIQARSVLYYSNSFKLRDRLQSEDRPHRIGQKYPVNYTDLVCPGTVDVRILRSLRTKYDVASQVTGDQLKEWI